MEDKAFELMSRMYSEFSEFKKEVKNEFSGLKDDVSGLKDDVGGLKNDVIRLENKLDSSTKALFDGYQQTYERLGIVENKIDTLTIKVDKQEVEIRVIKGGKT